MYAVIKRSMDIIFSFILLIVLLPVIILAAILIKLELPRSKILFKQIRPGKNEKLFTIYKFRTMREEIEDENGRTLSDIERMTSVGKVLRRLSIDELPQLINILKGEMSFIGPRPLLVQYLECYSNEQHKRHQVRPGISGWAQVNGRNKLEWGKKFELDLWYVEHISFWLDMKIVMMTIINIVSRKGINYDNQLIMPYFTGKKEK